jgi:hypothetical protein
MVLARRADQVSETFVRTRNFWFPSNQTLKAQSDHKHSDACPEARAKVMACH